MYKHTEKLKENNSRAVLHSVAQKKGDGKQGFGLVDNRIENLRLKKTSTQNDDSFNQPVLKKEYISDSGGYHLKSKHGLVDDESQNVIQGKFVYAGLNKRLMKALVSYQKNIPIVKEMGEHKIYTVTFKLINDEGEKWLGVTSNKGSGNVEIILNLAHANTPHQLEHTLTHELLLHGSDHFLTAVGKIGSIPSVENQHDRATDTFIGKDYYHAQLNIIKQFIEKGDFDTATEYTLIAMQETAQTVNLKNTNRKELSKGKELTHKGYSSTLTKDECTFAIEKIINLKVEFERELNKKDLYDTDREKWNEIIERIGHHCSKFSKLVSSEMSSL